MVSVRRESKIKKLIAIKCNNLVTLKFDSYNIDPQSIFLHCQYFLITSLAASLSRKYDAKNGYSDLLAREQSGSVFQLGIAFSATGQSLDFTAPVFFDHST